MKKIKVLTHYFEDDPTFIGDYTSVEVFLDDLKVVEYGDAYHDRGAQKADGFVDAVSHIYGADNCQVIREQVADYC